jgi:hypothetical protein
MSGSMSLLSSAATTISLEGLTLSVDDTYMGRWEDMRIQGVTERSTEARSDAIHACCSDFGEKSCSLDIITK